MNIKDITYAVWRKLEGGHIPDDTKYTYRELSLYVRGAVGQALQRDYFQQINAEEFRYVGDSIAVKYKVSVTTDEDSGLKTLQLPQTQINVPSSLRNIDISSLNPVSKLATTFIPVRLEEVFTGSLQEPIPCVVLYYQEGRDITFYNGDFDDAEVRVAQKYSLPTDDSGDAGVNEENLPMIISLVEGMINPQRPSDRANDGIPLT